MILKNRRNSTSDMQTFSTAFDKKVAANSNAG
jgi:hypothetical protein